MKLLRIENDQRVLAGWGAFLEDTAIGKHICGFQIHYRVGEVPTLILETTDDWQPDVKDAYVQITQPIPATIKIERLIRPQEDGTEEMTTISDTVHWYKLA